MDWFLYDIGPRRERVKLYDVRVFVGKFWYIYLEKLCFFEILFSGIDPFVYLISFPTKICLFATVTLLFAIILMSSI